MEKWEPHKWNVDKYDLGFLLVFLIGVALIFWGVVQAWGAAGPVLKFSDITSGPQTGLGDGLGSGAIVTIWGDNLGPSQGGSNVYMKDSKGNVYGAAHVYYWKNADGQLPGGPADLYSYQKMQEAAFSVPAAVANGAASIYVTVGGVNSNPLPFTVEPGHIYFVDSTGGSDLNVGSWTAPWATIDHIADAGSTTGACSVSPGDIVYIVNAATGPFIVHDCQVTGSPYPVSAAVYPGSSVTVRDYNDGVSRPAIRNYNTGTTWNFSKFTALANSTGINTFEDGRIVGNAITNSTCANGDSGAISGGDLGGTYTTDNVRVLGNYIHDFGCASTSKLEHDIYITNRSGSPRGAFELGWNYLRDNDAEAALHVYDEGGCGDWTGAMKLHGNVVVNQRGAGFEVASACNSGAFVTVPVQVYNNLFVNTGGAANDASDVIWCTAMRLTGSSTETPVKIYNNTVYGWGDPADSSYCMGDAGLFIGGDAGIYNGTVDLRNNIFYGTNSPAYWPYYSATSAPGVSTNNLWFNSYAAQGAPAWDLNAINADPLFTNATAGDFSLRPGSRAIGSGDNSVSSVVTSDLLGAPRSDPFDVGAFRYRYAALLEERRLLFGTGGRIFLSAPGGARISLD